MTYQDGGLWGQSRRFIYVIPILCEGEKSAVVIINPRKEIYNLNHIAWVRNSSFLCFSHMIRTIPVFFLALLKVSDPIGIIVDRHNVLPAYTFLKIALDINIVKQAIMNWGLRAR
jgi:hypothetical protein